MNLKIVNDFFSIFNLYYPKEWKNDLDKIIINEKDNFKYLIIDRKDFYRSFTIFVEE